jgi:hypothetical protein
MTFTDDYYLRIILQTIESICKSIYNSIKVTIIYNSKERILEWLIEKSEFKGELL